MRLTASKKIMAALLPVTLVVFAGCEGSGPTPYQLSTRFLAVEEQETVADSLSAPRVTAKDELLVFLAENATPLDVEALYVAVEEGGRAVVAFEPDLMVLQVRGASDPELAGTLRAMGGVRLVSPNFRAGADGVAADAPREAPTVNGDWWVQAIGVDQVWDHTEGNPSTTVAIVDRALPFGQGLLDEARVVRYNRYGREQVPPPVTDPPTVEDPETGHGAWMAGLALGSVVDAENYGDWFNGGGNVCGVDHLSSLAFVSTPESRLDATGKVWLTDLLTSGKTATGVATLVNIPWSVDVAGCAESTDPTECGLARQREFRAAMISLAWSARERGGLLFFSAGNDGAKYDDLLFEGQTDADVELWRERVVTVGASRTDIYIGYTDPPFTRGGAAVDLYAPGEDVGFAQDGVEVYVDEPYGDGTSFASALALGVASLLTGYEPTLAPTELRKTLLDYAGWASGEPGYMPHLDAMNAIYGVDALSGATTRTLDPTELAGPGAEAVLDFPGVLPKIDIVFLVDISGSFDGRLSLSRVHGRALMEDFAGRGVDAAYGVAGFSDYPFAPFGSPDFDDRAYYFFQGVTTDTEAVGAALDGLYANKGGDGPEAQLTALLQCATGVGQDFNGDGLYTGQGEIPPSDMAWRPDAKKIVVLFTDDIFHDRTPEPYYPGPTRAQTIAALEEAGITVVGMNASSGRLPQIEQLTWATGGETYYLPDDPLEFSEEVMEVIRNDSGNLYITAEIVSGGRYVAEVGLSDVYWGLDIGGEIPFTLTLASPYTPAPEKIINDEVVLWLRGDGDVIARYRIPVRMTKGE